MSKNALIHGLLSKKLTFESDEERAEFEELQRDLQEDRRPVGPIERALVEEAAVCIWKLRLANGWEQQELNDRRAASRAIMQTLADNHDHQRLPLFTEWSGKSSAARLGWECQELTVRCAKHDVEEDHSSSGDRNREGGQLQIEAKLTAALESVLRYQVAIKRDLYRVLAALREAQRERKEGHG